MTPAKGGSVTDLLRRLMLRTSRSPLRPLWRVFYSGVARVVALVVAPRSRRASVYVAGSVARGAPLYGLSDIDLVAVAVDGSERRRVQERFERLSRVVPFLRGLIPHFWTYEAAGLDTALRGSYFVSGLATDEAVVLSADAAADGMGLLDRPGLYGEPNWRRLRGRDENQAGAAGPDRLLNAWLELQYRWRYVFRAAHEADDVHGAALAVGIVAEAARIQLWLERGERHHVRRATLERALEVMTDERDGLALALDVERRLQRSPRGPIDELLPCFVRMSAAIAGRVDGEAFTDGATEVELLGDRSSEDGLPLLDWRALTVPVLDWSEPKLPMAPEERLLPIDADPAVPAVLVGAAARDEPGRVPALRRESLLVEPTFDVWGRGRLRMVQCAASDPVSTALLQMRSRALYPHVRGWSARDVARRAVAEHRAWLWAPREMGKAPAWVGARPPAVWASPATIGLLFAAARAALFLDSLERGCPQLALTAAAMVTALDEAGSGIGADAAAALAALEESCRERQPPPGEVVGQFRRRIESLPQYARPREARRVLTFPRTRHSPPSHSGGTEAREFRIKRGTNVSNWLAQTWQITLQEREDAFGPDDAHRIRELGLDHVRLPIDEANVWHADDRMDAYAVAELHEAIEWCRDADLAVVVDLHSVRSLPGVPLAASLFERPDAPDRLARLWSDLSGALAELPLDLVAYDLFNEPFAPTADEWNHTAARALAAIRVREPDRTVVIGSNHYNTHRTLAALNVAEDPNVVLGIHYYDPIPLTHYRVPWNPRRAAYTGPIAYPGVPVPADELARLEPALRAELEAMNHHYDFEQIRADLEAAVAVAARTGHGLYCAELGVFDAVPDDVRLRWYRDTIEALEQLDIPWATWQLRGRFGLYDGEGPTVVHRAIAERRFARDGMPVSVPG